MPSCWERRNGWMRDPTVRTRQELLPGRIPFARVPGGRQMPEAERDVVPQLHTGKIFGGR